MKVYITKWLFSRGIIEAEMDSTRGEYGELVLCRTDRGPIGDWLYPREYYKTESDALDKANKMIEKKINTLEKLIQKMRNFEIKINRMEV